MGKSFLKKGLSMILTITLLIDALLGITLYIVVKIASNRTYEVVVKSNESMLERMGLAGASRLSAGNQCADPFRSFSNGQGTAL